MYNEIKGIYEPYESLANLVLELESRTLEGHIQLNTYVPYLLDNLLSLLLLQTCEGEITKLPTSIEVVNRILDFEDTDLFNRFQRLDKQSIFTTFNSKGSKDCITTIANLSSLASDKEKLKLIRTSFNKFTIDRFNAVSDLIKWVVHSKSYTSDIMGEYELSSLQSAFFGEPTITKEGQDVLDAKIKLYNYANLLSHPNKLTEDAPFVLQVGSSLLSIIRKLEVDKKLDNTYSKLEEQMLHLSTISKTTPIPNEDSISILSTLLQIEHELAELALHCYIPYVTLTIGITPTNDSKVEASLLKLKEEPIMGEEIVIYVPNSIPVEEIPPCNFDTSYIDEFEL